MSAASVKTRIAIISCKLKIIQSDRLMQNKIHRRLLKMSFGSFRFKYHFGEGSYAMAIISSSFVIINMSALPYSLHHPYKRLKINNYKLW